MFLPHHKLVLRYNDTAQGLTNCIKAKVIGSSHVIVRVSQSDIKLLSSTCARPFV